MAEFLYINRLSPSGTLKLSDVAKVADLLIRGGLAVLPTETGYMLAALATDVRAVERGFAVKRRDPSNPMHIACSSLSMVENFAKMTTRAMRLLGELTPGPVTVVVEQTPLLPDRLVTLNGTVGIRIPDHPATLQIISAVNAPLTATSVNESGSPYAKPDREVLEGLNWPPQQPVYVVDSGDDVPYPMPSTLVRVTGPQIEILRRGPISDSTVFQVAGQAGYLEVADAT